MLPWFVGAGIVGAVVAMFSPVLGGDDVWLRSLADGSYTGEPTERLIFMNVVLGWVLRGLYTLMPSVAWYSVLLYALLVGSIAVVVRLVREEGRGVAIAVLVIGLYFLLRPVAILSWTETGLVVVGAGLLLACCGPARRDVAVVAGLVIGVGYLVRMESLGMGLAFVPLLWLVRDRWRHLLVVGLVALAVVVPSYVSNELHYSGTEEWQNWAEFEAVRRNLHGTPAVRDGPGMEDALAAAGWSKNDLDVFLAWYYANDEVYSAEAVRAFQHARGLATRDPWGSFLDITQRHLTGMVVIGLALALAGVALWKCPLAVMLWLMVMFTVMESLYRSRARVEAVIVGVVALGLIMVLERRDDAANPLVVLAASVLVLPPVIALAGATRDAREIRDKEMATLRSLDPAATYVQVADALPLRGISPFAAEVSPVDLVMPGWTVRTPHFEAHLSEHGLADPFVSPVVEDRVYMVGVNDDVASIVEFIEAHRGIRVAVERVGRLSGSVKVWKLSPA